MRALLLALFVADSTGASACAGIFSSERGIPHLVGNRRVLFVGNSHTYVNDLPGMVQALARAAGDTALRTAEIAEANFALEDHLAVGTVVTALPESQVNLKFFTEQFDPLVRAAGATPVLYQIWPMWSRRFDADAALTSYWNAAAAVNGILAPASDGFTAALAEDPRIAVYSGDGLHASRRGTYVAAFTIIARILEIEPESLPPRIPGGSEDSLTVRILQRAARTALARSPARPTGPRLAP